MQRYTPHGMDDVMKMSRRLSSRHDGAFRWTPRPWPRKSARAGFYFEERRSSSFKASSIARIVA